MSRFTSGATCVVRRPAGARLLSLCLLLSMVMLVEPAVASGVPPRPALPTADAAWRVFLRGNASFLRLKRAGGGGFDWSDNGCSVPWVLRMSVPALDFVTQAFASECSQHDFAYRNFGGVLRLDPSSARRRIVDRHFYSLLRARCRAADMVRRRRILVCRIYARAFYVAVRSFGRM